MPESKTYETKILFTAEGLDTIKTELDAFSRHVAGGQVTAGQVAARGYATPKDVLQFNKMEEATRQFTQTLQSMTSGNMAGGVASMMGAGVAGAQGMGWMKAGGSVAGAVAVVGAGVMLADALAKASEKINKELDITATALGTYTHGLVQANIENKNLKDTAYELSKTYGESAEDILKLGRQIASTGAGGGQGGIFGGIGGQRGFVADVLMNRAGTTLNEQQLIPIMTVLERTGRNWNFMSGMTMYAQDKLGMGLHSPEFTQSVGNAIVRGLERGVSTNAGGIVRTMAALNMAGRAAGSMGGENAAQLQQMLTGKGAEAVGGAIGGAMGVAAGFGGDANTAFMIRVIQKVYGRLSPFQLKKTLQQEMIAPSPAVMVAIAEEAMYEAGGNKEMAMFRVSNIPNMTAERAEAFMTGMGAVGAGQLVAGEYKPEDYKARLDEMEKDLSKFDAKTLAMEENKIGVTISKLGQAFEDLELTVISLFNAVGEGKIGMEEFAKTMKLINLAMPGTAGREAGRRLLRKFR